MNATSRLCGKVANLYKIDIFYFYHKDKVEHLILDLDWPHEVDSLLSVTGYQIVNK